MIGLVWDRLLEPPPEVPWNPLWITLGDAVTLAAALFGIAVMGRLERRSFSEYGLVFRRLFGRRFWEGTLWGLAVVAGIVLPLWAVGGYAVESINLHGTALVTQALLWGLAFLAVGVAEEALFRSYALYTLARGMGFWPAAGLLSALFGVLHYVLKPGETWIDGASTGLLALFLCLAVRRTGDIGLAAGFHAAFNFTALFLFGGANSGNAGQPITGRLLDASVQRAAVVHRRADGARGERLRVPRPRGRLPALPRPAPDRPLPPATPEPWRKPLAAAGLGWGRGVEGR